MIEISAQNFVFAMFLASLFGAWLAMTITKVLPYIMGWRDFTYHVRWTPANRIRGARERGFLDD